MLIAEDFNNCQEKILGLVIKLLSIENIFSFEDSEDAKNHFILTTVRNEQYEVESIEISFNKTILSQDDIDIFKTSPDKRIMGIKKEIAKIKNLQLYISWYDSKGKDQCKFLDFGEIKEIKLIEEQ